MTPPSPGSGDTAAKVVRKLAINRCPTHGWWAITIDSDSGGQRVTPSKCCGRWDTVKAFALTPNQWRELAEECERAAVQIEEGPR